MNITQDQVERLVALLRKGFPDWNGFDHPGFMKEEIDYKQATVHKAAELLSQKALQGLLDADQMEEFISRLETIGQATNLLWLNVPKEGDLNILYGDHLDKPSFCRQIFDLLYSKDATQDRFQRYMQYVQDHELPNKWTFPTYFLFFCHPKTEIFVKPGTTQRFLRRFDPTLKLGRPSVEGYHRVQATRARSSRALSPTTARAI